MKKLLIAALLCLGVGTQLNAFPPEWELKYALIQDYDGGMYLDGSELRTAVLYRPFYPNPDGHFGSATITISRPGTADRVINGSGSFYIHQIIGEKFYYDINVTITEKGGKTYTARYYAYNSGLQLP